MIIEEGLLDAVVTRFDSVEIEWLKEALSFTDRSAFFRAKAAGGGDGRICLLRGLTFGAGLLPLVRAMARADSINVEVRSTIVPRPIPDLSDPAVVERLGMGWLREHQLAAIMTGLAARRGVLDIAVSGGKTDIALGLARAAGGRWLFLAHRGTLVDQADERRTLRLGDGIDELCPGGVVRRKFADGTSVEVGPDEPCFLTTTFQSVTAQLPSNAPWARYMNRAAAPIETLLETFDGVILEECHTVAAKTFMSCANRCINAYYRIGISGTPMEQGSDRAAFVLSAIGPIIFRFTHQQLLELGFVSEGLVHMVPFEQRIPRGSVWTSVYREGVVRSNARNGLILDMVSRAEKPAMVFVADVKGGHLAKLTAAIKGLGIKAASVSGSTKGDRLRFVRQLQSGALDVIVCTEVFQEGIDCPELASVIVAAGEKSGVAAVQRLGRGVRKAEGKSTFTLYDVFDYVVDADKDETGPVSWLEKHSRVRMGAYQKAGHKVVVGPLDGPTQVPKRGYDPRRD